MSELKFPFARSHPLENLFLDPDNPRLPTSIKRSQEEIIAYLSHHSAIEDLVSSISENGFFYAEALVAIPSRVVSASDINDESQLIVVEGNRRLTALKLLQQPELAQRRSIRSIAENASDRPSSIPIIIYENRESVLQFLGYRHITGVKPWDPLAKARYIQQLFERSAKELSFEERYREVAQMVGSKPQYIRRSLNALVAIQIAEENTFFDLPLEIDDIEFSFVLTALGYSEVQRFVVYNSERLTNWHLVEQREHVNLDSLKKLFAWMFEPTKAGGTRLGESRNIKKLAAVVATPRALERFESGLSIDQAYLASQGVDDDFMQNLNDSHHYLNAASQALAYISFSEVAYEVSINVSKQARHIQRTLESKRDED